MRPTHGYHSIGRRLIALAVLAVGLVAGTAVAQQQVNPMDPIVDFFQSKAGKEYAAQFLVNPTPGASTVSDPVGDFEHSSGQPPGFTPDHIDIVDTWVVDFDPGPIDFFTPTDANQFWAPTGPLHVEPPNLDGFHTFSGEEVHDGTQYAEGALLFGFTLADTPPVTVQGRCEFVVWINDLSRGPTFLNHPSFPGDPAGGTNVAYGLGINPEGQGQPSAFALELEQKSDGFLFQPMTDVRSFITPSFVGITVPKSDIGELAAVNFYTFCVDEGFSFAPEDSGADQTGLIDVTFDDLGLVSVVEVIAATSTTLQETETTTTTAAPPPTTAGPLQPELIDENGEFPWWLLVVGGLGVALLGWWLFARKPGDPCKELYDAWVAAQAACDEAQEAADEAADDCVEAELDLEDLEQERKDACTAWPPACWSTEDGGWVEDDQGNRVTSRDVHMRKMALGEIWSDYKAGKLSATEVEAKWREMDTPEFREEMRETDDAFKELLEDIDADLEEAREAFDEVCDRAEEAQAKADAACETAGAAKKAYEDCIGAATAEAADDDGGGGGEQGPEGPSGPGVASGPGESAPEDPCKDVDPKRKHEKDGRADQIRVNVDFSIITGRYSGSERNVEAGERLIVELNDLARDLDFAGDMMNARSAGLHIGSATAGYRQGKYVATGAGIVRGGIDATMATTDLVPDVPTTPVQAGTEFLEQTARLGALVTSKVTEWMGNYQIFTVRRSFFYQIITATPYKILECREGQGWVCVERVWEFEVGKLQVLKGKDRWFTVNSSVRRRQFQREITRLSSAAGNTIRNDARRLIEWRAAHEPGPC